MTIDGDYEVPEAAYKARPSERAEGKRHIVIVGAGIVGACTAYYLTENDAFVREQCHITVIESTSVACGASGKAGGLLASWAFPHQIVPLSFQLHQELADEHDGERNWDYRRLATVSMEADLQGVELPDTAAQRAQGHPPLTTPKKTLGLSSDFLVGSSGEEESSEDDEGDAETRRARRAQHAAQREEERQEENRRRRNWPGHMPRDLDWVDQKLIEEWSMLGGTETTAQVHPHKFTHHIMRKALETGCVDLVRGKVSAIHRQRISDKRATRKDARTSSSATAQEGAVLGLTYYSSLAQASVKIDLAHERGDALIVCMGPWTARVLADCPVSGLRAHSITVRPPAPRPTVSPYAIFTELRIGDTEYFAPELYARHDEVYICGEGDTMADVPDTADQVEVLDARCNRLFRYASLISPVLAQGRILRRQACYLPVLNVATSSGPLIGETNCHGLFVASGHSCWGINNAPATGRIMAELILEGHTPSADISALDPKMYFDALL